MNTENPAARRTTLANTTFLAERLEGGYRMEVYQIGNVHGAELQKLESLLDSARIAG